MSTETEILIVDDDDAVRRLIGEMVSNLGHNTDYAENGLSALAKLKHKQPDAIFMDVQMPGMNGVEALEHIKADPEYNNIPVIMVSGFDQEAAVMKCLELGADDFITKPCNFGIMKARLRGCLRKKQQSDIEVEYRKKVEDYNIELESAVKEQVAKVGSAHLSTIFALSKLAESRDPETGEHLERMREYCRILSNTLMEQGEYSSIINAQFTEDIFAASPLHDIGKVGIPDSILLKEDKLTDEEFEVIKLHPGIGAETLRAVNQEFAGNNFIQLGIEIAQSHHEKWDGSGYPGGLSGEDIPIAGRVLALGDVYDALTSRRCYKEAFSREESKEIILDGCGSHFDPKIVDAFVFVEDEFANVRKCFDDKI